MVTPVTARRLANAAVALAFAGSAALLGGVAWADPTPAPAGGDGSAEAPVVQPSIGTWIIGGTELAGTAAQPAKPAVKPAAAAPARPARTSSTSTSATTRRTTSHRTASPASAPDGATALPFTGNHVDALLPAGITLLVGGVVLTLAGRPRRVTV